MEPPAARYHGIAISSACPGWLGVGGRCIWCQFCQASPPQFGSSFCLWECGCIRCRVPGRQVSGCCVVHGDYQMGANFGCMVVSCICDGFLVIWEGTSCNAFPSSWSSSQYGCPQTHAHLQYKAGCGVSWLVPWWVTRLSCLALCSSVHISSEERVGKHKATALMWLQSFVYLTWLKA